VAPPICRSGREQVRDRHWGGSSLAVMKATQHLPEAAEVEIWLNTNP
jgi:hypothetical protein